MSTVLTERPHSISFSKNEIRYMLEVSDPATAGCAVDFEIYYHDITATGAGTRLASFTLYPTAEGIIYCHIASYLEGLLKMQLPVIGGANIAPVTEQVKRFYIKYRQVTTDDPEPDWISDIDNKFIVIYGGVEQKKFKRNNFFLYQSTSKMFLTWQPAKRYVCIDQAGYLTFLLTSSQASFTVHFKVVYTDSTFNTASETYSLSGDNNILFRLKTGVKERGLDLLSSKTIFYYEVSVTGDDDVILGVPYRYNIDHTYLYSFYDLLFFNSLGGLDSVRVKGDVSWSIEANSEEAGHIIYNDDVATDRPQHQFSHTNIFKRDKFNGDAGWNKNRDEQEALIELLISPGIYEIVDERWIRVLNLKKNVDLRNSTDKKWSYPVEWNHGYEERVFTPKRISLGAGTAYVPAEPEPPVCIPVTIPAFSLPDGIVGVDYYAEIELGGTAPFDVSGEDVPDWMEIDIVDNKVIHTGTPDAEATGLNVSYTVNNCSGSSDDFIDEIDVSEFVVETGKNPFVINEDDVNLQLLSHGTNYPSAPTTENFVVNILQGTSMEIVTPAGNFLVEFFTSFGMTPVAIYSVTVANGVGINFNADANHAATGVNNINYIRVQQV